MNFLCVYNVQFFCPAQTASPKRKQQQVLTTVTWPSHVANLFVNECLTMKASVQRLEIPPTTWKNLSTAMTRHGYSITWTLCRDKFKHLSDFFANKMLPVQGVMAGVLWPYYERFCQLYDIPVDYVMPNETGLADAECKDDVEEDDPEEEEGAVGGPSQRKRE